MDSPAARSNVQAPEPRDSGFKTSELGCVTLGDVTESWGFSPSSVNWGCGSSHTRSLNRMDGLEPGDVCHVKKGSTTLSSYSNNSYYFYIILKICIK